jgi:hypothetical protein
MGMQCTIAIVGSCQAVRARVRCISSTVVERDMVNVNASAVANAEAMNRVVLNVDVMN